MSYYKQSEDSENKIITHNPLPSETISIMFTESDIRKKISKDEDPIQLSIEKWEKIFEVYDIISKKDKPWLYYSQIYDKIGYDTCALCLESKIKYEQDYGNIKTKEERCSICPLSKLDCCIKEDSVYSKIEKLLKPGHNFDNDSIRKDQLFQYHNDIGNYIKKMIDLLNRLNADFHDE